MTLPPRSHRGPPAPAGAGRRLLITGGAGFIGVNSAAHFAAEGWQVTLYDNLSRPGSERNLEWIRQAHPQSITWRHADVRDQDLLSDAVHRQDAVLHLAAQVAVTTSLGDPEADFEINARGTLNLLEAMRRHAPEAALIYASTNKVYGTLEGWRFERSATRWVPDRSHSTVSEGQLLDFHSPYGCSKGAADQYVRDYARCFGLKTVVLRQSCVYGQHQYGNEDQGWVAHFVHSVASGAPLTIYGDGAQVRDLLDVRDLCGLYSLCFDGIEKCTGEVFNIGGGADSARSVLEVLNTIEELVGKRARFTFEEWRAGDQVFYVSDLKRVRGSLGWQPAVEFDDGLRDLVDWARTLDTPLSRTARLISRQTSS